jgi:hypothetical protein
MAPTMLRPPCVIKRESTNGYDLQILQDHVEIKNRVVTAYGLLSQEELDPKNQFLAHSLNFAFNTTREI